MSLIERDGNHDLSEYWQRVTYTVENRNGYVSITAHLPPGFSMPEFTRMYKLENAKTYGLSEWEYVELQQKEMFNDLIRRLPVADQAKLLS